MLHWAVTFMCCIPENEDSVISGVENSSEELAILFQVTLEDAASLWDRPQPVWWARAVASLYLGACKFIVEGRGWLFFSGEPFCIFWSCSSSALLCVSKACCLPHHLVGQRVEEKEGISRRGVLWYSTPLNYFFIKSGDRCCHLLSCHMEARLPLETVGSDVSRGEGRVLLRAVWARAGIQWQHWDVTVTLGDITVLWNQLLFINFPVV